MINDILKLPKGLNEFFVVVGLIGLFFIYRSNKKWFWITLSMMLYMLVWRIALGNFISLSSRYMFNILWPFIFSVSFLVAKLYKSSHWLLKGLAFGVVVTIMILFCYRAFKRNRFDMNLYAISEIVSENDSVDNNKAFTIFSDDYNRILYMSKKKLILKEDEKDIMYPNNFGLSTFPTIYKIEKVSTKDTDEEKNIVSSFPSKNGKKRIIVSKTGLNDTTEISTKAPADQNSVNQLSYPDLEIVDTYEESFSKLKRSIRDFSKYYGSDKIQTAKNTYFEISSEVSSAPIFGIHSKDPLNGRYSAFIESRKDIVSMFFQQRFNNGKYKYSFAVRGKKGSVVIALFSTFVNRKRELHPLCCYSIPDSQTHFLTNYFSVDTLIDKTDFFLVGLRVLDGTVSFDDFSLLKMDPVSD